MNNALMVIFPYLHKDTWVFDDADVGLVKEPFVFGVPEMIDDLVSDIPNAKEGFRLIFSQKPFPNYQRKLTRLHEECEGYWYTITGAGEGWLCPALFKYFDDAPEEIYVKAESK
ncbi:MAG: hypothetical protein COB30_016150 [Ectothiorhodospiraceae bacterium]|nr:hypothetical protein [Ectothiorhodospiraceae bacterium]